MNWPIKRKYASFFSIKGVNTDHGSFDHRSPYKLAIRNFSSLSSSTMSSNGASNDNCITCKQPVRPRQEGLQCDGCQKWNHRTCNTGMSKLLPPVYLVFQCFYVGQDLGRIMQGLNRYISIGNSMCFIILEVLSQWQIVSANTLVQIQNPSIWKIYVAYFNSSSTT